MSQDTRNLLLAMGLSILVLVGWQYFIGAPQMERQREAQQRAQQASPPKPADPATGAPANIPAAAPNPNGGAAPTTPQAFATREDALKDSPRIAIDTPSLSGSIALKGARIDDVSLRKYRETVDPKSANIVLLSPSGAPQPYYAELGFVGASGQTAALPSADTVWKADRTTLTEEQPVTLTWDNGQGLVFHRTIAVDKDYLFTVSDSVTNSGAGNVTLYPFALVSRHGRPVTSGYAVLHEGLLGIVGDSGVQEYTYEKIEKETQRPASRSKGTGGWLGFTDKYWAAVVAPRPDRRRSTGSLSETTGTAGKKYYQADALRREQRTLAPGGTVDVTSYVFAGAKVNDSPRIVTRRAPASRNSHLLIDWGYFYLHHPSRCSSSSTSSITSSAISASRSSS